MNAIPERMDAPLGVLIVDDERFGREVLRSRLEVMPQVRLLGESASGVDAARSIARLSPDVVFVNVDVPAVDLDAMLHDIVATHRPVVIPVSAHDHVVHTDADVDVLDCVSKPFTARRLLEALRTAAVRRSHHTVAQARQAVGNGRAPAPSTNGDAARSNGVVRGGNGGAPANAGPRRLVVRERSGYVLVPLADVEALEAAGNYVRIVTDARSYLMRATMTDMEATLEGTQFVRIHRSTIVNVDRIERIKPHLSGDFEIELTSGRSVRMSRNYRRRLLP